MKAVFGPTQDSRPDVLRRRRHRRTAWAPRRRGRRSRSRAGCRSAPRSWRSAEERLLHRLQLAQDLGVADEVQLGGLVDQLDGLRLALGGEDLGLPDALRLLDLGAALTVGLRLGGGGVVDGGDLLVLGLDHLVHGLLHVRRRVDLLELGAQDLDAPAGGLDLERASAAPR